MSPGRSAPRPDLEAFDYATRAPFKAVVKDLIDILGAKLVAYIAGVRDARIVRHYAGDNRAAARRPATEPRLRLALRLAMLIRAHDSNDVTRAWFIGLSPQLDDRSPAQLLRDGDINEVGPRVVAAARILVASG